MADCTVLYVNHLPVIASRPATRSKSETCFVLLVRRGEGDYVTWMYNPETGGCSSGHYDMSLTEGAEDFASRGGLRTCTLKYALTNHATDAERQLVREASVAAWSAAD